MFVLLTNEKEKLQSLLHSLIKERPEEYIEDSVEIIEHIPEYSNILIATNLPKVLQKIIRDYLNDIMNVNITMRKNITFFNGKFVDFEVRVNTKESSNFNTYEFMYDLIATTTTVFINFGKSYGNSPIFQEKYCSCKCPFFCDITNLLNFYLKHKWNQRYGNVFGLQRKSGMFFNKKITKICSKKNCSYYPCHREYKIGDHQKMKKSLEILKLLWDEIYQIRKLEYFWKWK